MAALETRLFSLKCLLKSQIHHLLLVNGYKTAPNPFYNHPARSFDRKSNGFVSESAWFSKRDNPLKSPPNLLSGAKIIEQPVEIDCGDLKFQTWNRYSEIDKIDSRLLEILMEINHNEMSTIQKSTFDILNGNLVDILGSAETGSGKTLAFLTPLLNRILSSYPKSIMEEIINNNNDRKSIQFPIMLVLAPTRELVQQISGEARKLARLTPLRVCDVIGGVNIDSQINRLGNGCHTLIATPGRLIDLLSRGVLSLKHCHSLVLDEADRMLDMGFEPQIRQITTQFDLPPIGRDRQTAMFSATFPHDVIDLARQLLRGDFGRIIVGNNAGSRVPSVPSSIEQSFILSDRTSIFMDLFKQIEKMSPKKIIVFCNRKKDVEIIGRFAEKRGINVSVLYGDLSQRQRDDQLRAFKTNKVTVLIATSVAARGIDVADVECVVNYGLPVCGEEYVHRVGRCGRMGRRGEAVTMVTEAELSTVGGGVVKAIVEAVRSTGQTVPPFMEDLGAGRKQFGGRKYDNRGGFNRFDRSEQDFYGEKRNNYNNRGNRERQQFGESRKDSYEFESDGKFK